MSNWEEVTLDKLGKISWGVQRHTPKSDKILFDNGSIPFIEETSVKEKKLYVCDCTKYYNCVGLKQSKLFPKDTVCITNNGRINSAILNFPSCLCTQLHGFNVFENVSDSRFIKYCFNFSKIWRKLMNISSIGGKHLTVDRITRVPFPKPPIEVQKKIGKLLSTYDLLIENYEKQINLLKQQRSKLFQRWFVYHKFQNLASIDLSNWKKLLLKNLVTINSGKKLSGEAVEDGKYPFFTGSKEIQKINDYSFDQQAILLSTSANIFVKYYSGKFDARTTTLVLSAKSNIILWVFELL